MSWRELLKEMCLIPAVSGYEARLANFLVQAFAPYADEVSIDRVGNVIARITGTDPAAPTVMVFAHRDQLGLVGKITADGFLRVERLGGVPEKVLPGLVVQILSETGKTVSGVIGVKSHHLSPLEEKYRVLPYQELYFDFGAKSSAEVQELGIEVGTPVAYEPAFTVLQNGRVAATSLDDRGGCATLVRLAAAAAAQRPAATLYLVGTVQEEFNLRGAQVAAQVLKPDLAIALDVMVAGDTPDLADRLDLRLGGGRCWACTVFMGVAP